MKALEHDHRFRWLYAYRVDLPDLKWGSSPDCYSNSVVSWCGNRMTERAMVSRLRRENPKYESDKRRRIGKKEASATPIEFRDVLIQIAESSNNRNETLDGIDESND